MKYAFINDNLVLDIKESDEEQNSQVAHLYQHVWPIDSLSPEPQVGWAFVNGVLRKNLGEITPRQLRQAMVLSGVALSMIDDVLGTLPEPLRSLASISWNYAVAFDRYDPLVIDVGSALGWGSSDLDMLWELAGSL